MTSSILQTLRSEPAASPLLVADERPRAFSEKAAFAGFVSASNFAIQVGFEPGPPGNCFGYGSKSSLSSYHYSRAKTAIVECMRS